MSPNCARTSNSGVISALLPKDLTDKTWARSAWLCRAGKSGGGLCYGHRETRQTTSDDKVIRGGREIVERQACFLSALFERPLARSVPTHRRRPSPRFSFFSCSSKLPCALSCGSGVGGGASAERKVPAHRQPLSGSQPALCSQSRPISSNASHRVVKESPTSCCGSAHVEASACNCPEASLPTRKTASLPRSQKIALAAWLHCRSRRNQLKRRHSHLCRSRSRYCDSQERRTTDPD